ncbi:unnamed protein product [Ambrosiozyma monospora]|uniref:Unnamed protein product n=1 Tax=Ambrosiozyma monospora TaxID=43982 RepID=A0ACB5SVH8_AMBMO|nr:unnamed protein product [Ambrosiozyma monospora]
MSVNFKDSPTADEKKSPSPHNEDPEISALLPDYGKRSYLKVRFLVRLNLLMFVVSLASTNTGYDCSLLNSLQSMPNWRQAMILNGKEPTGAILGALSNGVTFGVILAALFSAQLSDFFGRRHCIAAGNIIMLVGVIIQSAAQSYGMFLAGRIILGFGNCFCTISAPTLISELSYPSHRQVNTACYNTCWYLGAVIAAWVSYGTRNVHGDWCWRIPSICQGAMPIIQIAFIYFVPESPRWLVSKGRAQEARAALMKHHGNNNEAIAGPLVDFEIAEISAAIEAEKIANKFSYLDFFKTPANRKRLFLLAWVATSMQLSGNGLVSYYLNLVLNSIGITSTDQQLVVNGGLMIYNCGIAMFVAFIVDRFRRRSLFLTSYSMMLFFYIIWTILSAINQKKNFENKSLGQGVLAMIFFYYLSYNIGMNGLPYLYYTEILPFTLRAKGINIQSWFQQVWSIYNGFVNPIAMDAIQWKYYIVYCCIIAVELIVCYFTFVETSGKTLEEVAVVFGEQPISMDSLKLADERKLSIDHAEEASLDV